MRCRHGRRAAPVGFRIEPATPKFDPPFPSPSSTFLPIAVPIVGSIHLDVPPGGDVHFTEAGSDGATTSLKAIVAASASLAVQVETGQATQAAALTAASADMSSDLSTQIAALSDQTAAQLSTSASAAVAARAELATTLNTSIRAAVRESTEAIASTATAVAEHDTQIQSLVASLVPSQPSQMSITPGSNGFDLSYSGVESAVHPFNFSIQVAGYANHTAGTPQWIEQLYPMGPADGMREQRLAFDAAELVHETAYVARYRAVSRVGAGEWSTVHQFNTSGLLGGNWFNCTANNRRGGGRVTMCTVTITVPTSSVVYAWFQGHYKCNNGWLYGKIRIDDDVRIILCTV